MSSPLNTIAAALVTELNVASRFSMEIAAERSYEPILDLKEEPTLRVAVVTRASDSTHASRTQWQRGYVVDLVFQKKVANTLPETIDPLTDLAEEVAEWFRHKDRHRPLPSHQQFYIQAVSNDPVYSQELIEKHVFAGMVTLTFQEVR